MTSVATGAGDVSRETYDRLKAFEGLVAKWSPRINLVSKSDLSDIWGRHILDSLQLVPLVPGAPQSWVDLGSGGGFPGIVIAIVARDHWPDLTTTLIESDQRKATFLRTAIRELDLAATVRTERIEEAPPQAADVLTARALAALDGLFAYAEQHLAPDGVAIFPKGRRADEEIAQARENWTFDLQETQSITDPEARILTVRNIKRARP
ncbi:16S rRNA (guanine(527)-N(7))-methyltransferase RsmG [Loktanella sp. IMCC34160]|uniref:16S rRNA (guanine(527)-N(7))-methyltransferase RsmG n=1 Tax=Loktanella sp. IMCC34160 TaxID=2510646 RepID=UPI00101D5C0F|nr:16S rRNA (guanine(527)-N(7))-methyltransferase RsmG [Loktanella sp. IMCC34160]RYG91328.1 16S rRNA (guanine(527)-N(7))-methyltransferase RsmG [Loktanella sp. IMCC34160]